MFCLGVTVALGAIFLALQVEEYLRSWVRFNRTVYGSAFFFFFGFHGLHVTIWAIALSCVFFRFFYQRFSRFDHVGFEGAAWY